MQPKEWFPTQQPACIARSLMMNKSMNTLKIDGDKELPWRTPQLTTKLLESALFHLTATVSLPYQVTSTANIQLGNPDLPRDSNSFR
jgi:hypothetical protein